MADKARDSDKVTTTENVYGGPPATGPTPTVPVGEGPPDTANLTDSGPEEPTDKPVKFKVGDSAITVSKADAEKFRDMGYK